MPMLLSSFSLFLGTIICIISFFFLSFIDNSVLFSEAEDKFYVVSKNISFLHTFNKNFSNIKDHEISKIANVRGVKNVGKIYSSKFPCRISVAGFYSEIFLESLENQYIAITEPGFDWDPNQNIIPIIISKEFLHIYNYSFVRSNSLPVLTENTAKLLPISIDINGNSMQNEYKATIHGFTDRYLSILVPMEFLLWANNYYTGITSSEIWPTKLVVEISENDPGPFLNYLRLQLKTSELKNSSIYEITKVAHAATNLNELYKSIHTNISKLMYAENFYIALYKQDENIITFPYWVDKIDVDGHGDIEFDSQSLTGHCITLGKALLYDHIEIMNLQNIGKVKPLGTIPEWYMWLGVPLRIGDNIIVYCIKSLFHTAGAHGGIHVGVVINVITGN